MNDNHRFGESQTRNGVFKFAQADDVQRVQTHRIPNPDVGLIQIQFNFNSNSIQIDIKLIGQMRESTPRLIKQPIMATLVDG